MGVVEMTVRRSLARLEKMGFIIRERNANERTIVLCPDGNDEAPGMTLKLLNAC
jgi:DNA-binding GntR family transcriptional regulator